MAGLGELVGLGSRLGLLLDVLGLHGRGQETDIDGLTGLHLGDGTRGIATARELLGPLAIFVTDPSLRNMQEMANSQA